MANVYAYNFFNNAAVDRYFQTDCSGSRDPIGGADFTVEAWLFCDSNAGFQHGIASLYPYFSIRAHANTQLQFCFTDGGTDYVIDWTDLTSMAVPTPFTWFHIRMAVQHRSTDRLLTVFYNNQLLGSASIGGHAPLLSSTSLFVGSGASPGFSGSIARGAGNYFISQFRLWEVARTEVYDPIDWDCVLFNSDTFATSTFGMQMCYNFEESGGTTIANACPNNTDFTAALHNTGSGFSNAFQTYCDGTASAQGFLVDYVSGMGPIGDGGGCFGPSYKFYNSTDHNSFVFCPSSDPLDSTTGYTVEFWAKPYPSYAYYGGEISSNLVDLDKRGQILLNERGPVWVFQENASGDVSTTTWEQLTGSFASPFASSGVAVWAHLRTAVTYQPSSRLVTVFVNNVSSGSFTVNGTDFGPETASDLYRVGGNDITLSQLRLWNVPRDTAYSPTDWDCVYFTSQAFTSSNYGLKAYYDFHESTGTVSHNIVPQTTGMYDMYIGNSLVGQATGVVETFDYAMSSPFFGPTITDLCSGMDGNVWFTGGGHSRVGNVDPSGVYTLFSLPGSAEVGGICAAIDGSDFLWLVRPAPIDATSGLPIGNASVGKISVSGVYTEYSTSLYWPGLGIAAAKDGSGDFWFCGLDLIGPTFYDVTGKITSSGVVTLHVGASSEGLVPNGIIWGSDNNLWCTKGYNGLGKINPSTGAITWILPEVLYNSPWTGFLNITSGKDGKIWFRSGGIFGNYDPVSTACTVLYGDGVNESTGTFPSKTILYGDDDTIFLTTFRIADIEGNPSQSSRQIQNLLSNYTKSGRHLSTLSTSASGGPQSILYGPGGEIYFSDLVDLWNSSTGGSIGFDLYGDHRTGAVGHFTGLGVPLVSGTGGSWVHDAPCCIVDYASSMGPIADTSASSYSHTEIFGIFDSLVATRMLSFSESLLPFSGMAFSNTISFTEQILNADSQEGEGCDHGMALENFGSLASSTWLDLLGEQFCSEAPSTEFSEAIALRDSLTLIRPISFTELIIPTRDDVVSVEAMNQFFTSKIEIQQLESDFYTVKPCVEVPVLGDSYSVSMPLMENTLVAVTDATSASNPFQGTLVVSGSVLYQGAGNPVPGGISKTSVFFKYLNAGITNLSVCSMFNFGFLLDYSGGHFSVSSKSSLGSDVYTVVPAGSYDPLHNYGVPIIIDYGSSYPFTAYLYPALSQKIYGGAASPVSWIPHNLGQSVKFFGFNGAIVESGRIRSNSVDGYTVAGIFGNPLMNRQLTLITSGNSVFSHIMYNTSPSIVSPVPQNQLTCRVAAEAIIDYINRLGSVPVNNKIKLSWHVQDAPFYDPIGQAGDTAMEAVSHLASRCGGVLRWDGNNNYMVAYPDVAVGAWTVPSCSLINANGLEETWILDLGTGRTGVGTMLIPYSGPRDTGTNSLPTPQGSTATIYNVAKVTKKLEGTDPPLIYDLPQDYDDVYIQVLVPTGQSTSGRAPVAVASWITTDETDWFSLDGASLIPDATDDPTTAHITNYVYYVFKGGRYVPQVKVDSGLFPTGNVSIDDGHFVLNIGCTRKDLSDQYAKAQQDAQDKRRILQEYLVKNYQFVKTYSGTINCMWFGSIPLPGMYASATSGDLTVDGIIESVTFTPPGFLTVQVAKYLRLDFQKPPFSWNATTSGQAPGDPR